ncbi:NUDIX domain-containing protein [Thiomicrorhabdus sp. 6S2-11]|uniref:ADP-ribose pyrophosphatase n=1 Tax=Thiomicrorhabdus marina TaxID=2818442 RepID=A0ABS3Q6K2_9GAMM|nr:NUDIX domain-containing protein [Thiomicrorhabdus marina]MBO1927973.1 NUDIX domain-containing protein [Thiomicrorhabdus marina]
MSKSKQLKILDRRSGYQGFFRIDVLRYQHSLYAGGLTIPIERELFGRGQASVLLLYDLQAEKVVLIEQCRAGALGHALQADNESKAWLIEPIAGMIDQDETAEQAAIREAQEEAGVEIAAAEYICQFYPSPGGSDEILHLYASAVDIDQVADYAGLESDVEDIRVIKMPFGEAKQKLLNGEFNVASTLIALQWLFFQKLAD